jgi:hypothetical protein
VTYKTGFGLNGWIYWILEIHTTRDYRQLQRYRYSIQFPVHRYTRTRILSLHYSYPGNGFIADSLSLQIAHDVFFAPLNSLCFSYSATLNSEVSTPFNCQVISWQAGVPKLDSSLLDSIQLPAHILAGWRTETRLFTSRLHSIARSYPGRMAYRNSYFVPSSRVLCYDRRLLGQSDSCGFVDVGRSL